MKQLVFLDVFASVFSTRSVDVESDLSLQTSELVRVYAFLFDGSYSYTVCDLRQVDTCPSTSIYNRQLERNINTSFVDSDSNNGGCQCV